MPYTVLGVSRWAEPLPLSTIVEGDHGNVTTVCVCVWGGRVEGGVTEPHRVYRPNPSALTIGHSGGDVHSAH